MLIKFKKVILLSAILLFLSIAIYPFIKSSAQTEDFILSLSSARGNPGQTVSVVLSLDYPDQPITAGFVLDINFDPLILENPSAIAGSVLIDAQKQIGTNLVTEGNFRILAFGFNQNLIQAGEAALISFDIKLDAPAGQTDLTLSNLAGNTPDGQDLLDVIGLAGIVTVNQTYLPTDLNQDGQVNTQDLNAFKTTWGTAFSTTDFNQDTLVNSKDLGIMLSTWTE